MKSFKIREVSWAEAEPELRLLRTTVFIVEQHVPVALEWDGLDAGARHVLARNRAGEPVGAGRLLPDGQIGRMAVLKEWRGRGIGSALLDTLLRIARTAGLRAVFLNSQTYIIGFYSRRGFRVVSSEFMEAGIPHVRLARSL
jgi:predicted GNAT family N-acyltransferase